MSNITIIHDDLLRQLRREQWLAQSGYTPKFHAVIGDPPYFLGSIVDRFGGSGSAVAQHGKDGSFSRLSKGFMGKQWDGFANIYEYQSWVTEWARLMLDFVYPGAVLAMFGGTRTYHRLTAGLEDAGWTVYDGLLAWTYGSGFPKSYNYRRGISDPKWDGYSQALKPSYEPIVLARAPRNKESFVSCAINYATGGLNIDGARIATDDVWVQNYGRNEFKTDAIYGQLRNAPSQSHPLGRYPANTLLVCECDNGAHGTACPVHCLNTQASDEVSRFFYCAKSSTEEREYGLDGFVPNKVNDGRDTPLDNPYQRGESPRRNTHPTVKPIQLIEWLAHLLLPPVIDMPRRILVPFSGSGSEMIGCHLAGWDHVVGIERESEYVDIAEARTAWWSQFTSYEEAVRNAKQEAYIAGTGQLSMFDEVQA